MNNDAHGILVSAVANHGEKIATMNAYCQVYLAGYMVDYPHEKQLLTSLRQSALPDALIAHRGAEVDESDVYTCINDIVSRQPESEPDLAWGVDAWAAALSLSEVMRRNIRQHCFPELPPKLNTDSEPVTRLMRETRQNGREAANDQLTTVSPKQKNSPLMLRTAMVLVTLSTIHFAVGSIAFDKKDSAIVTPLDLPEAVSLSVLPETNKPTNTALTKSIKTEPEVAVLAELKAERTQRLNADIEAFLTQAN
ncbi:hypothetical protein [Leucothrix pacifica]|uniref:Uncharacterized protein n=1 Tax=Leucothrix pacifica TaxID=1247513 RepID=A0A317CEN7_9GAMM|nr:hypothetical protein [Leucothrix pacifica]PWQ96551.1 hypothetical protein DKW60_12255 [Leucothrix pacifica]